MIELLSQKKIKINLNDYDYAKDIQNRKILSKLNNFDIELLDHLLYSPTQISISDLSIELNCNNEKTKNSLEKFASTNLYSFADNTIIINKQVRKYFDLQILKFEDSTSFDFDYIKLLLKNLPINILPLWYIIPKNSNNIFDSIYEKYLKTPKIYAKHLLETKTKEPIIDSLINEIYTNEKKEFFAENLKEKYNLSDEEFYSHILFLEYSFIAFIKYKNVNGHYKEILTPFAPYINFKKIESENEPMEISNKIFIKDFRNKEFAFVDDLSIFLEFLIKNSNSITKDNILNEIKTVFSEIDKNNIFFDKHIKNIYDKLIQFEFVKIENKLFINNEKINKWLCLSNKDKAITIYQNIQEFFPKNLLKIYDEKMIRKAERFIQNALNFSYIYIDDFIQKIIIPIREKDQINLIKEKGKWKYKLPMYNDVDIILFKTILERWFFETGIITLSSINRKKCFQITEFGRKLFEK